MTVCPPSACVAGEPALGDLRISKVDLAAAYRHIPVRPEEVAALGMRGPSGELYFDQRLPFGLASAPAIFTTISSLLRDIAAKHLDIETYVYVDDFGILSSQENAERDVAAFVQLLDVLGAPVSSEKLAEEGRPAQVKTYLGVELDLREHKMRLPQRKREELDALLLDWMQARTKTVAELRHLAGRLQWAATVIFNGRAFLRSAYRLIPPDRRGGRIAITPELRADLGWWRDALRGDVSRAVLPRATEGEDELLFATDASDLGWGAHLGDLVAAGEWDAQDRARPIAERELLAVALAIETFQEQLRGRRIALHTDNEGVRWALVSERARSAGMARIHRALALRLQSLQIELVARRVDTEANSVADALSRGAPLPTPERWTWTRARPLPPPEPPPQRHETACSRSRMSAQV